MCPGAMYARTSAHVIGSKRELHFKSPQHRIFCGHQDVTHSTLDLEVLGGQKSILEGDGNEGTGEKEEKKT